MNRSRETAVIVDPLFTAVQSELCSLPSQSKVAIGISSGVRVFAPEPDPRERPPSVRSMGITANPYMPSPINISSPALSDLWMDTPNEERA